MMNFFDITEIEGILKHIVRENRVSDKVYISRPTANPDGNQDFVVAKVMGRVTDRGAYGECTCSFHLFAKDVSGEKNQAKLSVMQRRLYEAFPVERDGLVFSDAPTVMADTTDNIGYHVRIININTLIKVS